MRLATMAYSMAMMSQRITELVSIVCATPSGSDFFITNVSPKRAISVEDDDRHATS
jgi:hypothetical protein